MLHKICRPAHAERAAVEHFAANHSGLHIQMAQQLLNGAVILAPFQQVCRLTWPKASVAEGVAAGLFGHPGFGYGVWHQH